MSPDAFKVYTLRMIERAKDDTSEAFLDGWARTNAAQRGFSIKEARRQLDLHVKAGHFKKIFDRRSSTTAMAALSEADQREVRTK